LKEIENEAFVQVGATGRIVHVEFDTYVTGKNRGELRALPKEVVAVAKCFLTLDEDRLPVAED
jgi:hypothetical protein